MECAIVTRKNNSMQTIRFEGIDRVALFGGSWITGALCRQLVGRAWELMLFSSSRHLDDAVEKDGTTLQAIVDELQIRCCSTPDINVAPELRDFVTPTTLGIALGAAWIFERPTVELFGGKLLDFMGIDLPRYRGGAHETWRILHNNRKGCCNLQVIHGGRETFHKGEILKRMEFTHSESARIPQDYIDEALPKQLAFLEEFFEELTEGREFSLQPLDERDSSCFPFLNTPRHGWVNWQWTTEQIDRFIRAFDEPYAGASSSLRGRHVFLKGCRIVSHDPASGHGFGSGLVFRKTDGEIFVATPDGAIALSSVTDDAGRSMGDTVSLGQRFYTSGAQLDAAMTFDAYYDADGLQEDAESSGKGEDVPHD